MADHDPTDLHVCFVCSGNICRSPMAAVVFREHLRRAGLEDTVTVVRFSQIVENPPDLQDRLRGVGGAQN